jgi:hypothetical protein
MRRQEFQLDTAMSAAILVTAAMLDALLWTERSITLSLPVCGRHKRRGRKSNQTFFRGMALSIAFGVAAYIGSQFDAAAGSSLAIVAILGFIVTIVAAMHEVDDSLKIKSPTGGSFILSGVSTKFAQAVERRAGEPNR